MSSIESKETPRWSTGTFTVRDDLTTAWQTHRISLDDSRAIDIHCDPCNATHTIAYFDTMYSEPSKDPRPEIQGSGQELNSQGMLLAIESQGWPSVPVALIGSGATFPYGSLAGVSDIMNACPEDLCLKDGIKIAMRTLQARPDTRIDTVMEGDKWTNE